MNQSSNLRGIIYMVLASLSFVSCDSFLKLMLADVPPFQSLVLRGISATVWCFGLLVVTGQTREVPRFLETWTLLRTLSEVVAISSFIIGLAHVPLADITAIYQISPLIVLAGAHLLWGEHVGAVRWALIGLGLAGALLVAQPGTAGASPYALLGFVTALGAAGRDLLSRKAPADTPGFVIAFGVCVAVMLAALLNNQLFESWQPVPTHTWLYSIGSGFFVMLGHYFVFSSFRHATARAVAPFYYCGTLAAALFGVAFFGEWLNTLAVFGMILIIACGLGVLAFEQRKTRMNFTSDNVYGVDSRIMQAMVEANARLTDVSYCHDDGAKAVDARLSEIFGRDVRAFLVVNGTGANSLALSAICPTYGGVFCHETSHINTDECNCPELFMGGGKLVTMAGEGAKLAPAVLADKLSQFGHGEHGAKPCGLSITNATELGTVYTPTEIRALADVVRPRGMKVHMDGARFANALVALGCSPAALTWEAGVDVLSFGGTKNGGMILEAVVFFDTALADDFLYRRKRTGQLVSKGRFLSAQMLAYLQDDVWLANARRANSLAQLLAKGLQASNRVRLSNPVQANEVFAIMPKSLFDEVQARGVRFYDWPWDGLAADEIHCRFVTSFATPEEHVAQFLQTVRELS